MNGHFVTASMKNTSRTVSPTIQWYSIKSHRFFFIGAAVLLCAYRFAIRSKKLIADEKYLIFSDKEKIAYDSIEKIDKTYFKSKGRFVITYKDKNGKEVDRKITDRQYDNLEPVLDHLVAEIT